MNLRTKAVAIGAGSMLALSVAGTAGASVSPVAADYPAIPGKVSCKAKAVQKKSKIKVNMGPNLAGNAYYTFRIDKKTKSGWVRQLKTYKTKGSGETRVVNRKKGTYRVKCYGTAFPIAAPGLDATSGRVKLKR